MLTAEYGGTGGKPIESGMVVEEPDIEIGAGVSSKGLSYITALRNHCAFANFCPQQSADAWRPTKVENGAPNHLGFQMTDINDVTAAWT